MKFTAHQFVANRMSLSPSSVGAGTVNGTGINVQGVDEALVVLQLGTLTATATLDVKVQHSDDDSTYVDITGAVFAQKLPADSDGEFVGRIDLVGAKKFIRLVAVTATANTVYSGHFSLIMGPGSSAGTVNPPTAAQSQKDIPVSQINAVEFNIADAAA